jgi:hypothetical protein
MGYPSDAHPTLAAKPALDKRAPAARRRDSGVAQPSAAKGCPPVVATPPQPSAVASARKPGVSNAPQPAADPGSLQAELRLLGAAQDALHANQPGRALQLVQQHEQRFPRGALTRERLSVQALALCGLQRTASARLAFDELMHLAPDAPVLARIRTECGFASTQSDR